MSEVESGEVVSGIPNEFIRKVEDDLNKIAEITPEYLSSIHSELQENFYFPNAFEFLTGLCVGHCMGSYVQAYQQIYQKVPSSMVIKKIHDIVFRRRMQIEQSVCAFLEENNFR